MSEQHQLESVRVDSVKRLFDDTFEVVVEIRLGDDLDAGVLSIKSRVKATGYDHAVEVVRERVRQMGVAVATLIDQPKSLK